MKKLTLFFLILISVTYSLKAQFTVTGSNGADGNYVSLTNTGGAFAAINAASQSGRTIIITVTASSPAETGNVSLTAGAWSSLTIMPTGTGYTIGSNANRTLINLDGAGNVIIDGRVNGAGSTADLTIINNMVGTSASTIGFINSAENNIIKYCKIGGSCSSTTRGVIFFSTSASGNGNDGNTLYHNYITNGGSRPANIIYSSGTAGSNNSGNTVTYNYIFDYSSSSVASNAIYLNTENSNWTISNNSFYETTAITPGGAFAYAAIRINTTGNGFSILNNSIGGRDSICGGSAWTKTVDNNNAFLGISLTAATGVTNTVDGNRISNFDWNNSGTAAWTGIAAAGGDINIGTGTGNTIGDITGADLIKFNSPNATNNLYGISVTSTGTIDCQNNKIGAIHTLSNNTYSVNIYGIYKSATAGSLNISNNTVGSGTTAGSINAGSLSTSTSQIVTGIHSLGTGSANITGNTVANLINATTNSSIIANGRTDGIYCSGGPTVINNNVIHDLTIQNGNKFTSMNMSVCGIALGGNLSRTIKGNTIGSLSNTSTGFTGSIAGIYFSGDAIGNTVSENFINSLSANNSAASIYGIRIASGLTTYSNNIISICTNNDAIIYGIYETGGTGNDNKLYFNSINLGGTVASGSAKSYALYSAITTNIRDFRNNILMNSRSTAGGSNLHYSLYIVSTAGTITCSYNDYFVSGAGSVLGYFGANKTSLPIVASQDAGSHVVDPGFATPCGTTAASFIPSASDISAFPGTGILTDYAGITRSTTYPSMGAHEVTVSSKVDVYKGGVLQSSYHNLKETFDAFNSGVLNTGAFEVRIKGNLTEPLSAVLKASGTGSSNYSSITIFPTITGISVTSTIDSAMIDLSGASNVTIDGRVGGIGIVKDMTLVNTSNTAVDGTAVVRFINGASSNTIKYCKLKGSSTATGSGIILFGTAGSASGNNSNIISNNDITSATDANRPVRGIYSSGTASLENKSNTVSDNEFFNLLNRGKASSCIYLDANNSDWIISKNSFYESASLVPTASIAYTIIWITNTGSNYIITENSIGGTAAACGGSAWQKTNAFNNAFTAIYLSTGNGTASSIQKNTIRNINWSNSGNAAWTGIQIAGGSANVGTDSGNNIGRSPGTGLIIVTSATTGNNFYGINITSSGNVECDKNIIGGITLANAAANASNFYGINKSATAGALILRNNIIGSPTAANSIISSSQSTGNNQSMRGIYSAGTGTITITGNTIANITNSTTNTATTTLGKVNGIFSSSGTNTIYANIIHDLTIANSNSDLTLNASICGIALSGPTTKNVSGNTIYNLSNTNASFTGAVTGLYFTGSTSSNTIEKNFIHDLSVSATSTAYIYGIRISSGLSTYSNNIVALKVNTPTAVYGLYEAGASGNNNNIYFNTLFICGTVTSGSRPSYALYGSTTANVRNYRDNLLVNTQSNSGSTGKHYAIYLVGKTGLTIDYNDYFVSGTGSVLGYLSGDRTTLAAWKTATGQDAHSLSSNPLLINPCGSNATDYVPGSQLAGITIAGITTDYGSVNRPEPPTIGAWEGVFNKWKGTVSDNWNTPANWSDGTVPPADASIAFDIAAVNNLRMDQNRSVNNIFNTTSYQLITNGFQLTIKGDIVHTGTGTINATAVSSEVVFAGTKAQNIPANAFYTNKVYNITVNNDFNAMVYGSLNILNNAAATMGEIDALSTTPEIILGGTTTQALRTGVFLYDELFNLTIDNTAGVTLNEYFTIDNNLTINAGRSFSLNPPGQATITSVINNGTLNLNSTGASAIYSLIMDSYTGSGLANVQLFLTGGGSPNYNWHYVAVPQDGLPVTLFTNIEPYNLMTYNDTRVVTSDFQGWSWWDGYDGYPGIPGGGGFTTMSYGKGYDFYHASDVTINFNGMTSLGTNLGTVNLQYSGPTPNSPIFGLNLLGNSLTCSIDWEKVTYIGAVDEAIYYTTGNKYVSYVRGVGGTNGATKDIPPLQGFIVKANATGASVDMSEAREHSFQPRYKKSLQDGVSGDPVSAFPRIRLELSGATADDETLIWFYDEATTRYDGKYDAFKLFNDEKKYSQLYSSLGGINYSINGLPVPDNSMILPLSIKIAEPGTFKFLRNEYQAPDGYNIYLYDKLAGDKGMNLSNLTEYPFMEQAGTISNRFYLKIVPENENPELQENVDRKFDIYSNARIINIIPLTESLDGTDGEVRIYDLTGRILKHVTNVEWHTGIPITIPFNQKEGIYLVEAISGSGRNVEKIFLH